MKMKKGISEGKFKRVCELPDTTLLIATDIRERPKLEMWHQLITVAGDYTVTQTLIARNKGYYYYQYKDWTGECKHYRTAMVPGHLGLVTGIPLLINRGGRIEVDRPFKSTRAFGAKIELI
ncbi:MAG: hypothetical protein ACRCUJ_14545 [Phocaeicola sp.]